MPTTRSSDPGCGTSSQELTGLDTNGFDSSRRQRIELRSGPPQPVTKSRARSRAARSYCLKTGGADPRVPPPLAPVLKLSKLVLLPVRKGEGKRAKSTTSRDGAVERRLSHAPLSRLQTTTRGGS